jgi:hypothetical protein
MGAAWIAEHRVGDRADDQTGGTRHGRR